MSTLAPPIDTVADVLERVGVAPERILLRSFPVTEEALLTENGRREYLCELVDGLLVKKATGFYEAVIAAGLVQRLGSYVHEHDRGILLGASAPLGLAPGVVRLPSVSFLSWKRFPGRRLPRVQVLPLAPDLAVEILSDENTPAEMERTLREYFAAGTRLVWYADPLLRTVQVFTSLDEVVVLGEDDVLDGADVVPGFRLRVGDWFDAAGPLAP
jgi:Uma2 family endonuclease